VLDHRDGEVDATVTYRVGERSWTQTYTAAIIDDEGLAENAAACDLVHDGWLDTARTWARLRSR
jgi:hypothetical protein